MEYSFFIYHNKSLLPLVYWVTNRDTDLKSCWSPIFKVLWTFILFSSSQGFAEVRVGLQSSRPVDVCAGLQS